MNALLASLLLTLLPFLPVQDPDEASPAPAGKEEPKLSPTEQVLAAAPASAREAWRRMNAACRTEEFADLAVTSFSLRANVVTREGVQVNQLTVDYRFLSPHFIRFLLPSGRETGRGPEAGQRGYWMKDGDEVLPLVGRESREDRRLVDEMIAVARNFIALSDPARVRLTRLESLPGPPPYPLPRELARIGKKLSWIRAASPDFALLSDHVARSGGEPRAFLVDLGLDPKTELPVLAVIREERAPEGEEAGLPSPPMLIHLPAWRPFDGFQIPWRINVHRFDVMVPGGAFAEVPAQEIVLINADLRPELKPEDFQPQ